MVEQPMTPPLRFTEGLFPTLNGPCIVCGISNYQLSMGGPSICPSCDCGNFGMAVVQRQGREIIALKTEIATLREELKHFQGANEVLTVSAEVPK